MNTISRFKSGRLNKAGTAFTTAATVAKSQHEGGPYYTYLPDVVEALERQGVTSIDIWKALYVSRSIGALEDVGEGFLKWAYDPRPFATKETTSMIEAYHSSTRYPHPASTELGGYPHVIDRRLFV